MRGPELLIPLTLFVCMALIFWKYFDTRHREKMAMIEMGMTPADFKRERRSRDPMSALKWGLLGTFVGGGLLLGITLVEYLHFYEGAVPTFGLISGGVALIIYYLIASRRERDEIHVEL